MKTHPLVVERLLALRDELSATLHRIPGPRTLQSLPGPGCRSCSAWPHATTLDPHDLADPPEIRPHSAAYSAQRGTAGAPGTTHGVEILNTVDTGTSILLDAHVRSDFVAETTLEAVAHLVQDHGLPQQVTFDRDPRCAQRSPGSAAQRDFPSAFLRFWLCLGVQVEICLPHHPQQNGFVERYHRTFKQECVQVYQPQTEDQVRTITTHFQRFYNEERPHQGLSCQNRPPRVAFPALPSLPAVPVEVDPDRWLTALHGRCYTRRVNAHGLVSVAETPYYIGQTLRGQFVRLEIDAAAREFVVYHQQQAIKRLPVKGLVGQRLAFSPWIEQLAKAARRDERRRWQDRRRRQAGTSPADTRC